jgi:hypothetical protein
MNARRIRSAFSMRTTYFTANVSHGGARFPAQLQDASDCLESALANLGIKDRNDPTTTLLAKLIIQLAKDGERDPTRLAERAIGIVRGSS